MVQTEFPELNDLLNLDLEYRLTVGIAMARGDTTCARYLLGRREVLIPKLIFSARKLGIDPVEHFANYARKAHMKLCEEKEISNEQNSEAKRD